MTDPHFDALQAAVGDAFEHLLESPGCTVIQKNRSRNDGFHVVFDATVAVIGVYVYGGAKPMFLIAPRAQHIKENAIETYLAFAEAIREIEARASALNRLMAVLPTDSHEAICEAAFDAVSHYDREEAVL